MSGQAKKIVLIDDNVDLMLTAKIYLTMQGFDVWVAHSGLGALALIMRIRPDVVFCDLGLPGMDGCQIAKAVRADPSLNTVRLLAMTAFDDEEKVAQAIAAGFERHLIKPTPLSEMLTHILSTRTQPRADELHDSAR